MSSSIDYKPGTIFRIYENEEVNDIHLTAVLTKDNKILEIKNPNSKEKKQFNSLNEWCLSHNVNENNIKVDTSKVSLMSFSKIKDGFNYPKDSNNVYLWVQWCYSIVSELSPELLESNELMIAYNNMVSLCKKHEKELYHDYTLFQGKNRYNYNNINYNTEKTIFNTIWNGYPGRFYQEHLNPKFLTKCTERYTQEQYNDARKEILEAYKLIVYIIKPFILKKMNHKYDILYTVSNIKMIKKRILKDTKKVIEINRDIKKDEIMLKKEEDKLAELLKKY
jgi:hypothetical protein